MVVISPEKVIEFIENTNNIKLYNYQKNFIVKLVNGQVQKLPRGAGTTMLVRGYAEYLMKKSKEPVPGSCTVSIFDIMRDNPKLYSTHHLDSIVQIAPEQFIKEFTCEWR